MQQIFAKPHLSRLFFLCITLILVLLIVIKFSFLVDFIEKNPSEPHYFINTLMNLVDTLIATIITSGLIAIFLLSVLPKDYHRAKVSVIEPKEISLLLQKSVLTSKLWIFKGSTGRYVRSTTLESMAKNARNSSFSRDIIIFTLNPMNDLICEEYTQYRAGVKSGSTTFHNNMITKSEILATLLTALQYTHTQPLLNIKLYWLNHFSVFRYDLSDEYILLTKEDSNAHALKYDSGTYFYDSLKDDLALSQKQSLHIDLYKINKLITNEKEDFSYDKLSVEDIKYLIITLLNELNFNNNQQYHLFKNNNNLDYDTILNKFKNPNNPYK